MTNFSPDIEGLYQRSICRLRELAPDSYNDLVILSQIADIRYQLEIDHTDDTNQFKSDVIRGSSINMDFFNAIADGDGYRRWFEEGTNRDMWGSWRAEMDRSVRALKDRKRAGEYRFSDFLRERYEFTSIMDRVYKEPLGAEAGFMVGTIIECRDPDSLDEGIVIHPLFSVPTNTFPEATAVHMPRRIDFQQGDRLSPERLARLIADKILALEAGIHPLF